MKNGYDCTLSPHSTFEAQIAQLKQRYDNEMLYTLINYRTCLFVNPAYPMPSIFNSEASEYYIQKSPEALFNFSHLFGFVSIIDRHSECIDRKQSLTIWYASHKLTLAVRMSTEVVGNLKRP